MAKGLIVLPNGQAAPDAAEEKAKSPDTYKSRAELVADNQALANTLAVWMAALEIIRAQAVPVPGNDGPMLLTMADRAIRSDKKLAEIRAVAQRALDMMPG